MKEYIDKLKEIETLVELSIGTTMTEERAIDIYAVTNDLMCKVKKLNLFDVSGSRKKITDLLNGLDSNMEMLRINNDNDNIEYVLSSLHSITHELVKRLG